MQLNESCQKHFLNKHNILNVINKDLNNKIRRGEEIHPLK